MKSKRKKKTKRTNDMDNKKYIETLLVVGKITNKTKKALKEISNTNIDLRHGYEKLIELDKDFDLNNILEAIGETFNSLKVYNNLKFIEEYSNIVYNRYTELEYKRLIKEDRLLPNGDISQLKIVNIATEMFITIKGRSYTIKRLINADGSDRIKFTDILNDKTIECGAIFITNREYEFMESHNYTDYIKIIKRLLGKRDYDLGVININTSKLELGELDILKHYLSIKEFIEYVGLTQCVKPDNLNLTEYQEVIKLTDKKWNSVILKLLENNRLSLETIIKTVYTLNKLNIDFRTIKKIIEILMFKLHLTMFRDINKYVHMVLNEMLGYNGDTNAILDMVKSYNKDNNIITIFEADKNGLAVTYGKQYNIKLDKIIEKETEKSENSIKYNKTKYFDSTLLVDWDYKINIYKNNSEELSKRLEADDYAFRIER